MKNKRRVLIITGSPKKYASTSNSLARYVKKKIEEDWPGVELKSIYSLLESPKGIDELFRSLSIANHLMISTPTYLDSLPWGVIKIFEDIFKDKSKLMLNKKSMSAIINCGYPEPERNLVTLDICKCFAHKTGMKWLGAVLIGNGDLIGDRDIESVKFSKRSLRKDLDIFAHCICLNEVTPKIAFSL